MIRHKTAVQKNSTTMSTLDPIRVCITGACGQIAYSLFPLLMSGQVFGPKQTFYLQLLDVTSALETLKGVIMELEDMACPLVRGIIGSDNPNVCFNNADAIFLAGSIPRKPGQELGDLLRANAKTFKDQGQLIGKYARKSVKVLVVGNPCNVNTMICMKYAPSIPPENFAALTRLDQLRAQNQLAVKLGVSAFQIRNLIVWGNHSTVVTFPDISCAYVESLDSPTQRTPVEQLLQSAEDLDWLLHKLPKLVSTRADNILEARRVSTGMAGAQAAALHMRDWWLGTHPDQIICMAVPSDQSYGVPLGLVTYFPVRCSAGQYKIIPDLQLSESARECIKFTTKQLQREFAEALAFVEND